MANLADQLKQVPLFSSLSQRQLKRLARNFKEREFRPGTSIVQQDQMSGVDFFVIAEGEASVSVNGKEIATMKPGDHFGELALLAEQARSGTVTAKVPMRCLVIASWYFRTFVKDNPEVSWKLLQHLANLLVEERSRHAQAPSSSG